MAMTLHELTGKYMELMEMAEEMELDPQTLADTFEGLEGEIHEKANGFAIIIRSLMAQATAFEAEIAWMNEKKRLAINNADKLKKELENSMKITKNTKFKTDLFSFNIQKNPPSLVIDDDSKVPEEFIKIKKEIDKTALKKFVKENENGLDFAHLEQTESLRIR